MADFEGIEAYVVNEYQFELREEYETALQEKKGVDYLDAQLDYDDTQKVLRTYNELLRKKIFYTPVGIDYLHRLRKVLINSGEIEDDKIMPLYVPSGKKKDSAKVEKYISNKYKETVGTMNSDLKKTKSINRNLIAVNIVLIIIIIAMFIISYTSDSPNILNYERELQDKYAGWAEDLKEKEDELRQREREIEELERYYENSQK